MISVMILWFYIDVPLIAKYEFDVIVVLPADYKWCWTLIAWLATEALFLDVVIDGMQNLVFQVKFSEPAEGLADEERDDRVQCLSFQTGFPSHKSYFTSIWPTQKQGVIKATGA